jgi:pimeloyl-ACP methyl ester carboxylesterase
VIGARDDALIPIHHAHRLNARLPHADYCEFEGAHFHPRTDPAPFAERVGRFLAITSDGGKP